MRKTLAERRVAIAKDALAQLKLGMYISSSGIYILLNEDLRTVELNNPSKDAQECLLNNKKPCKVCAKGALALSAIRKENNISMGDICSATKVDSSFGKNDGKGYLGRIFGKKNADLIEAVFEKWYTEVKLSCEFSQDRYLTEYIPQIKRFCKKYPDQNDRLVAILKNIIRNKGIFTFPKK